MFAVCTCMCWLVAVSLFCCQCVMCRFVVCAVRVCLLCVGLECMDVFAVIRRLLFACVLVLLLGLCCFGLVVRYCVMVACCVLLVCSV